MNSVEDFKQNRICKQTNVLHKKIKINILNFFLKWFNEMK
jgi:hypothetical protein